MPFTDYACEELSGKREQNMPAQKYEHQNPLAHLDAWLVTKLDKHLTQSAPEVIKRSDGYIISAYYLTVCPDEMKEITEDVKFKYILLQGYFLVVQTPSLQTNSFLKCRGDAIEGI